MPENHEALKIWVLVNGQLIVGGMGDVIDINHLAIWKDIEEYEKAMYGLDTDKWKLFNKIICLFRHMNSKQAEWAEEKSKNKVR